MLKRLFDFAAAAAGLLVLAPVMLIIALRIKMEDGGPVLFKQERIGLDGEPFNILKFRTMVTDAQKRGPQVTTDKDPRITRIGGFLRHYKLDELPQLINVAKGDMSVVGPRPEVPRYVATYSPQMRAKVLSVRPGMTDIASIAFLREAELLQNSADTDRTYIDEILPVKLAYQAEYVDKHSFLLDLKLIFQSLWRIVT